MQEDSETTQLQTPNQKPPNIFFRLTIVMGGLFAATIFALTASIFGDSSAPVHHFLNRYGGVVIGLEVVILLAVGLIALAIDRRHILENSSTNNITSGEISTNSEKKERE